MAYYDIFSEVAVPEDVPILTSQLMKLGEDVLSLARTSALRKANKLEKPGPIIARDGKHRFPVVTWQRPHGRGGRDVNLSLVDKREIEAGLLLTAHVKTEAPSKTAVHTYLVNNAFVNRGLLRQINETFPSDTAHWVVFSQQASMERIELSGKPDETQRIDYAKALSTVALI